MFAQTFSVSSSSEKLEVDWVKRCNHHKFLRTTHLIFEVLSELPLVIIDAHLRLILQTKTQ